MITDLVNYLNNNLLIAHYCGFDISLPLPSYWTFDRFLKKLDHDDVSAVMRSQVLSLARKGIIDTSFIGLDSTPVSANTSQNNPNSFLAGKFKPLNQPKSDRDCRYFKSSYSLRTEYERYNSRFKSTGQERMWVRNKSSVANLNTLAHTRLLAVTVAAITMPGSQSYRKLKTVKRTA